MVIVPTSGHDVPAALYCTRPSLINTLTTYTPITCLSFGSRAVESEIKEVKTEEVLSCQGSLDLSR